MRWMWGVAIAAAALGCETDRTVPARDAGPDATPVRSVPPPAAPDAKPTDLGAGDAQTPDGGAA